MSVVLYRQRPDFTLLVATVFFVPILAISAAPFSLSAVTVGLLSFALAIVALAVYSLVSSSWVVEYHPERKAIAIVGRTVLLRHRSLWVRADDIQSVVSFIALSKFSDNWVALVPKSGNRLFRVARFSAGLASTGRFIESRSAARVCEALSSALDIENAGYAGVQVPTMQGTYRPSTPQDRWLANQSPQQSVGRHG